MSGANLTARITRVAAGGMLFSVLSNLLIYLGQLVIARSLPVADYATFSVIISLLAFVAITADLGWTSHLVKRFAQAEVDHEMGGPDKRGALLGTALGVKALLAVASASIGMIVVSFVYGSAMGQLFLIGTTTFFFSSRLLVFRTAMESFIRAEGGYDKVLKLAALDALAFAVLLLHGSRAGLDLTQVVLIYGLCHIPGFILLSIYLKQAIRTAGVKLRFDWSVGKELFASALPLTVGMCFFTIYYICDTLILDQLSTSKQVADFAASFRLMGGLIFLPAVAAGVIVPEFIKLARQGSIEKASRLSSMALQALLSTVAFIALMLTSLAPTMIDVLLGAHYRDAAPLVIIFGWMFIPVAFASYMLELGIAVDRQRIFGYYTLSIAVISVFGALFVAAPFGALGVVVVKFAAVLIGCVVLVRMCWSEPALKTNIRDINWTKNAVSIAITSVVLAMLLTFEVDRLVAAAITAVVFIGWTLGTKLIDLEQLTSAARSFKK